MLTLCAVVVKIDESPEICVRVVRPCVSGGRTWTGEEIEKQGPQHQELNEQLNLSLYIKTHDLHGIRAKQQNPIQ